MIRKILSGFSCDQGLLTEIEKLAASKSIVDQAIAVGLVGSTNCWQPATVEASVRTMMGDNPIVRAREWAETLKAPNLGLIWTERGEVYQAVRDLVVSGEERDLSGEEQIREATLRQRLQALSFVIGGETSCAESAATVQPQLTRVA
jgi:hypothetical protein